MRWRISILAVSLIIILCITATAIISTTGIDKRIAWHLSNWQVQIRRKLNPPESIVFIPQSDAVQSTIENIVQTTMNGLNADPGAAYSPAAATGIPTSTPVQTQTSIPTPADTPLPANTPSATATPIPESVELKGILYEYQQFNNCGPANLAMLLSYWGWEGDQRDTRSFLRPNPDVDDKNVNPSEMVAFVETQTDLKALVRVAGDVEQLKQFIAAGFPILIEKGHDPPDDWWMGHYALLNAYDDTRKRFYSQDSLIMPDLPVPYEELASGDWRDFNYVYLIVYPPDKEPDVMHILGKQTDIPYNYEYAAHRAEDEILALHGRKLFFAWFNLGASSVGLKQYDRAATAFDHAFQVYVKLSEEMRPYRVMWYRTEPYAAYYYTGRYQDVIDLAKTTIAWVGKPVLEETYFWRGMAYEALGKHNQAVKDLRKAVKLNPLFTVAKEQLARLTGSQP